MNKLNSKNWMRLRINKTTKVLTFTNDTTYKTKADCEKDIKSTQYIAINQNGLNKLLSYGYMINDTTINPTQENAIESVKQAENIQELEQLNPDIEAQIEAYAKAKIERDIKAYEEKKRKQDAVKNFLSTPPKQAKQKPFDYSNAWNNYETKGKLKSERALNKQLAEYKEVTI